MSVAWGKAVVLAANVLLVAIRAPHGRRSRAVPVVARRVGGVEAALLALAFATFFVPFVWLLTPRLDFAEYRSHPLLFGLGIVFLVVGLWLFWRSHRDLGTNWSLTLEVREHHRLVTEGVYRKVRHPMYASLLYFSIGQALVLPNLVAGPAYLVAMLAMIAFRLDREESLMIETFGVEYEAYRGRTKRWVPGMW